jgi:hypothetical protein
MDPRKQIWDDVLALIVILFVIIFLGDWLFYNGIFRPEMTNKVWAIIVKFFYKAQKVLILFRFFYMVILVLWVWNWPSVELARKMTNDHRNFYRIMFLCTTPLVILGYHSKIPLYDIFLYPVIFFTNIYFTVRAINTFHKGVKSENILGLVSSRESDFFFEFQTNQGKLIIHSPQQNFWIDGGPGSGKSQSLIKPIIKQAAERGYAGVIYDYEGDPGEPEAPILGRIAYTALEQAKASNPNIKTNFSFINFSDMAKTVRVNPLSERYIKDRLSVQDLVQNLMTNLSVNKEKSDFWEKYGTALVFGVTWNLFKNYRTKGYATIPHVIAVLLNSIDTIIRWAMQDEEITMIMAPIISAWTKKAEGQLAGAETSAQLPVSILLDPNIFWVLSSDDFNLDITNKDDPYLLCVGNSKKLEQALAPAISVVLTVIMKQMNSAGKAKSIFCFDEFTTVKVNGIDKFIATARKHWVSTILGLQDFTQAERDYAKNSASILRSSCGNQFFGMTGNLETARYISTMLGEIKVENISYTTNKDQITTNEALWKDKVLQQRDIMGQEAGHFTGKIAGGRPPFFSSQFEEFKFTDKPIPDFACKYQTGDPIMDKKILDDQVSDNYYKILSEVKRLLAPYVKVIKEE